MSELAGKTLFITGASRGIGKAIALRAARDGANIAVAQKQLSLIRVSQAQFTPREEIEKQAEKRCPSWSMYVTKTMSRPLSRRPLSTSAVLISVSTMRARSS